jgi:zinc transport system substrate-binding protein
MPRTVFACTLFLLALWPLALTAQPQPVTIVTSIKPLALIAQQVAGADAQVQTLLPAGASPHEYALKVSDMRLIERADLALWVGPELEGFLQKPLGQLPSGRLVTAAYLPSIHWPRAAHHAQPHAAEHDQHSHHRDPHVWLNPANAAAIAQAVATRLGQLHPSQAEALTARAHQFSASLTALDAQLRQQLAPLRSRGFAVYHDGYRHFVDRYQLNQVDYVALTPEQRPGARHLYQLEQQLKQKAQCLLVEPYADTGAAAALAERINLRTGTLDPLASDPAITDYPSLMRSLAAALASCLGG